MIKQEWNYPGLAACEALWKEHHTPRRVIGHCKAVSKTASAIGEKLNEKGYNLNIPLIQSAGWLHDIARVEEEHWKKGAEIVKNLGYPDVADIIEAHMFYRIDGSKEEIAELDLVCLADRMVKEDHFVGLDERMDYIIQKAKGFPGAEEQIRKSFCSIRALKSRIEGIIGMTIEALMGSE